MPQRPRLRVIVSREDAAWLRLLPRSAQLLRSAALKAYQSACDAGWHGSEVGHECTIVLAGDGAVRELNRRWRGIDRPTNVLSFAALDSGKPERSQPWILGDVVLACGTIAAEALAQGKSFKDHALHLAAHGILHLLGYDHGRRAEARVMERLEIVALGQFGIADPYR